LFGLVLAVLWAVVLEHIDNTVHSAEQLEGMLESPVLGTLPLISSVVEHGLPQWAGERHKALPSNADNTSEALSQTRTDEKRNSTLSNMLLESCRIIRTNLTFASVDMPLRTLLVTSTNSGEGKSFVAWNMAAAMAYDGKKVILVDCDLRRPTQHKLHSLPLIPGFTNVLIDPDTLESALHQTSVDNLRIMPAGAIPPNPPELLGSEHSRSLIANLQEHCDVLVIDSPPVLLLTDAQILSGMVDGVVFVVGADTTSSQHIQRAQANIRHAGGRLLGFVLNKTKSHNDPYGYYAHYGYYKYYNYNEEARESEKASPKAS
jgi:capsular exopolysaccharide synthesis family protein